MSFAKSPTLLVASCLLVIAAFACGGGSPAGPSGPSAPAAPGVPSSGATIAGIVSGAGASAMSVGALSTSRNGASGLTVTVVGTDLGALVDASGYFQITNVPAGDVQLRFQGAGVDATVRVTGVGGRELIEIVVALSGSTVAVVEEARSESKASMCHRTAAGAYNLISVGPSAEAAHRAHGDAKPGEPVPGQTSLLFDVQCRAAGAGVSIEKSTNGQEADSAPGPTIAVGSVVTWTYVVTNVGTEPLANVVVSDDRGVAVNCGGQTTLPVGQSMSCTGSGVATAGQYRNVGTVTATAATGQVTDSDASHYYGRTDDGDSEAKVTLCHKTGNGRYQLLEVAASAEAAHRDHGDAKVGEPVPGVAGKVFGPNCSVQ